MIGMDLSGSALILDSGFDSKAYHKIIKEHGLLPAIYPHRQHVQKDIKFSYVSVHLDWQDIFQGRNGR